MQPLTSSSVNAGPSVSPRGCPSCGYPGAAVFFEARDVPVNVCIQYTTKEAARACPRGDIRLAYCRGCGLIFNKAFEPRRLAYDETYENSLYFSPAFRRYAHDLASELVERYDLRDKTIVEIGCGSGEFLSLLCRLGNSRGIGFDPGYVAGSATSCASGQVRVLKERYSRRYTDIEADFFVCRHVLEHMPDPSSLLSTLRGAVGNNTQACLYFEVPNVLHLLRTFSPWDVTYEHCTYFSKQSLARLFTAAGFHVRAINESFHGRFLGLEASWRPPQDCLELACRGCDHDLSQEIARFAEGHGGLLRRWRLKLRRLALSGRRAVVWGAGAGGVGFLNMLSAGEEVRYVVDISPRKHGKFVAGTGHRIVAPEFLKEDRPDVIVVMNSIYADEIRKLAQGLGVDPQFEYVC